MSIPPVPMSDELIAHHVEAHPCDGDVQQASCPCGDTVALFCAECGEALMIATRPGTWCTHAEVVHGAFA